LGGTKQQNKQPNLLRYAALCAADIGTGRTVSLGAASANRATPLMTEKRTARYKVELIFIDQADDTRDVSCFTYVEADNRQHAIELSKEKQPIERPDLRPTDRWAWTVFETSEQTV
jgi:hypothetical protein